MTKTIKINGINVEFKSSGALIRIYHNLFGRDLFKDMDVLKGLTEKSMLETANLSLLEDIAYCMAKHADPNNKMTIEEWLEQFDVFGVVTALPEIIDLWLEGTTTNSVAKKNEEQ